MLDGAQTHRINPSSFTICEKCIYPKRWWRRKRGFQIRVFQEKTCPSSPQTFDLIISLKVALPVIQNR